MRGTLAFFKKEIIEHIRNYKLFIFFIVFAIIGILSPLSAKFLPELLEGLMDENITIILQEPTYVDSWIQFFSNINQIGLVVMVVVFSPMMAREYEKGTLVHMVTKGLPRLSIYSAKLSILYLSWTVFYWFSFAITLGYTYYYFPDSSTEGLFLSTFSLYVFGLMLLALLLFSAILLESTFAPLLSVAGFLGLLFLGELIPVIQEWSPLQLSGRNVEWLTGVELDQEMIQSFGLTSILILLFIIGGGIIFKKKAIN
ncbi:MAG: ABC transporter permease subunit [Alkalibacterium sp.]|uniref:ABC transporter permease subunit n=1 Tax=Alkalibacterium sp. TaxID=1872447 RepID=UPI00397055A2